MYIFLISHSTSVFYILLFHFFASIGVILLLLLFWSWFGLHWWESVAFIVVHLIRLKWVTLNNIRSSFRFIFKQARNTHTHMQTHSTPGLHVNLCIWEIGRNNSLSNVCRRSSCVRNKKTQYSVGILVLIFTNNRWGMHTHMNQSNS